MTVGENVCIPVMIYLMVGTVEKIIAEVPMLRVMVVDDNVDAAETLSNLLELKELANSYI